MTTLETFKRARARSVPIVGIETLDAANTTRQLHKALNGDAQTAPVLTWDRVRGLIGLNKPGEELAAQLQPEFPAVNMIEMLDKARALAPDNTLLMLHNAHRDLNEISVIQAIWNCRDTFKAKAATLVLLGTSIKLPSELTQDAVILTEELPGEETLGKIVDSILEDSKLAPIDADAKKIHVDTLRGLSAFAAEQTTALATTKAGIDGDALWNRKAKMIEQTPGLEVWKGGETFAELGGLANLKKFLTAILTSETTPVRAILYLDEIEKSGLGAGAGDTSGTSQDQLGVILKMMEDKKIPGIILVGPPGTGKSSIAKGAGNVAGAPVIACDLGAMKQSYVGNSEARIRDAMQIYCSVSQGKGFVIATCNKLAALPPELKRRFSLGTFYVDLPTADELPAIWKLWITRYKLDAKQELPPCLGWTGAEVKACCDVAFRTGFPLKQAATFIVPVIKSAREQIDALRTMAHGNFISASREGYYDKNETQQPATGSRKMSL